MSEKSEGDKSTTSMIHKTGAPGGELRCYFLNGVDLASYVSPKIEAASEFVLQTETLFSKPEAN